jgi:epoxyqueuosine reductase
VGITRPDAIPQAPERLQQFLAAGAHGDMDWMAATAARRGSPSSLWPQVRSVIMLGLNYSQGGDPLAILRYRDRGAISVYAQGDDYHEIIKPRLKALARWLTAQAGGDVQAGMKVFVDTAAVMEKLLAAAAGLAGRASTPTRLARIRIMAVLARSSPRSSFRRMCRRRTTRQLPRLPGHLPDRSVPRALPARCAPQPPISPSSTKGQSRASCAPRSATASTAATIARGVPMNKFAQAGHEAKLAARDALRAPRLADLARLDDAAFRKLFAKSPVKRTGCDRRYAMW